MRYFRSPLYENRAVFSRAFYFLAPAFVAMPADAPTRHLRQ